MDPAAVVLCLELKFLWNGDRLTAGRLPFYGTEVANVRYPRGQEPTDVVLYRLDPEPVVYLAGKGLSVLFSEPLPAAPGTLEVRAALVPCADPELAGDARLRTPAAQQAWTAQLRVSPGQLRPITGPLGVERPFSAALALERVSGSEEFELRLDSLRGGHSIAVEFHRYVSPGRPPIHLVPGHRPFDAPVLRLRPEAPTLPLGPEADPD